MAFIFVQVKVTVQVFHTSKSVCVCAKGVVALLHPARPCWRGREHAEAERSRAPE